MSKLVDFIAGHLQRLLGNRRQAPRQQIPLESEYQARLLISITLPQAQSEPVRPSSPSRLIGSTRNLSETGLAIIVPSARIDSRYITEHDCPLKIELEIYPAGTIEIETEVVHYQPINEEKYVGYLLGVKITKMSEGDRALYLSYLEVLKYRAFQKDAGEIK